MQRHARRWLALLLAALLALSALTVACAEDWRDMLRDLYGLSEDYEAEKQTEVYDDSDKQTEVEFELPVTDPQQIVNYLSIYGELPENFITKREAKDLGWDSRYNYVGDVAPGMSIGGDRFGNYEGQLPKGERYYEADVNYDGGYRGEERIIYTEDGDIWYTSDHYESFERLY